MTELDPIVGNWYRHLDKGQTFRVVAVDDTSGLVEVQHFDGDVEEIESDAWADMVLAAAEEPEDWTGPVDDVEADDMDYSETDMQETDWRQPLREGLQGAEEDWEDAEPDAEDSDDWADEDADWGELEELPDTDEDNLEED
jgi:hypothetical protein